MVAGGLTGVLIDVAVRANQQVAQARNLIIHLLKLRVILIHQIFHRQQRAFSAIPNRLSGSDAGTKESIWKIIARKLQALFFGQAGGRNQLPLDMDIAHLLIVEHKGIGVVILYSRVMRCEKGVGDGFVDYGITGFVEIPFRSCHPKAAKAKGKNEQYA